MIARRVGTLLALLACAGALVYVERAAERPLASQPFPDSAEYASSARSLALGDGFYTNVHAGSREPPRYPLGYPLVLVPFASVGTYPRDVQRGAKFWVLFYVLATLIAAWALGGALAAAIAAGVLAASPFASDAAGLVMSDAFVAGLTVLMLPLLRFMNRSGTRLAGAATGLAMLARITAVVNLVGLLVALPRRSYRSILSFALPSLIGLALLQWLMFGSPLTTGYDYWGVSGDSFSLAHLTQGYSLERDGPWIIPDRLDGALLDWTCPCQTGGPQASLPNLTFYPLVLAGIFWVFSPPLLPLLGLWCAWRRRRDPIGRYALTVTVLTLFVYGFYFYQGTRFMAGPATILAVLGCVWLSEALERLGRRVRSSPALVRLAAVHPRAPSPESE